MSPKKEKTEVPMLVEEVKLPDAIRPGRYNDEGDEDPGGRVFLGMGSGIVHIWAHFSNKLEPGQMGSMTFNNTFGSYPLTGNFTEWMPGAGAFSSHAILRKRLGDPLGSSPLLWEEGDWINSVSVYENGPDKDPTPIQGSETNLLLRSFTGDLWISSNYTAKFHGMDFKQFGTFGFDHNTGRYHACWVKSAQSNLSIFEGDYDVATRTLTLLGETRNCFGKTDAEGKVFKVKERRIIHYKDRDTKHTEIFQEEEPGGRWVRRDQIVSRRREAVEGGGNGGNIPYIGESPMMLVSLQRGINVVRVIGQNSSSSPRHAAAGMIMLGPEWNMVFQDDVRLNDSDRKRSGLPPAPPPTPGS